jgi:hypothetical protein
MFREVKSVPTSEVSVDCPVSLGFDKGQVLEATKPGVVITHEMLAQVGKVYRAWQEAKQHFSQLFNQKTSSYSDPYPGYNDAVNKAGEAQSKGHQDYMDLTNKLGVAIPIRERAYSYSR